MESTNIAPPRIGSATGYFIIGAALIAFGLFAAVAAAGGGSGAAGAAGFCLTIGALLIGIGFWVRLFAMLELRLIDLQRDLRGRDGISEATAQPPTADQYAM